MAANPASKINAEDHPGVMALEIDEIERGIRPGQALFVGPTAYFQLSPRTRLTAAWSTQAWGRPAGSNAALDLVNFERHQARLIFGVNF